MRDLLILGSGRSGTSMVAGTLAASGWWVGDDPYPGRDANPKGFFETAEINGINEELLARVLPPEPRFAHGQRWLAELAADVEPRADDELARRIARLVTRRPFAFKDPRLCYTLDAWRPHLPPDTGRVCVFRDPAATAVSILRECREAPYLASLPMDEERALAVWCAMYERVLARSDDGPWLFLHYDQMLTQDGIARLERFAGGTLDRRFPEASLRRSQPAVHVPPRATAIFRELCERAGHAIAPRTLVPAPERTPELSVILCTYQRLPILRKSIASFEAQDAEPGSFELIVVDDGATDGTREWLDAHAFGIPTRVLHKPNGGLASARNAGIAVARGRLLLFVNDDTLAFPDLVREHLAAHANLAATGEEHSVLGSFEQPSAHLATALMRHLERSGEVFRYHDMRAGGLYDHNRFWTCNVSVPAARVHEAGGFDERFVRYGCEDIDLGLRLERLGLRVCYHPGARAHHEHLLDFAALKKRQLSCSASFVHLFAKYPSELDHPDWSWLGGRSAAAMRADLAREAERHARLEAAVATLARVQLPELEALGEHALVESTLTRLAALLSELNAAWWQTGLAQGLDETGLADFDALRALEPGTCFGGWRRAEFTAAEARAQLHLVQREAEAGATDFATLRALGLAAALDERDLDRELLAETLSDLAVLRHGAGDRRAALAFARRACELAPTSALLRENLAALEAEPDAQPATRAPWDALACARERAKLLRGRVLTLGVDAPAEFRERAVPRSWTHLPTCTALAAEALPDASVDVALVRCDRVERADVEALASELARVVRPGGRLVLDASTTWFAAQGAETVRAGAALPDHAHLLLEPRECAWYASQVAGIGTGRALERALAVCEPLNAAQMSACFAEAGFDTGALEPVEPVERSARLVRELGSRSPCALEPGASGVRGMSVRRGRTLILDVGAAAAAGA